jgi:hypothetical protein
MIRSNTTDRWSGGSSSIAARTAACAMRSSASSPTSPPSQIVDQASVSDRERPRAELALPAAEVRDTTDDLQEHFPSYVLGIASAMRPQVPNDLRRQLAVDASPRPLRAGASGAEQSRSSNSLSRRSIMRRPRLMSAAPVAADDVCDRGPASLSDPKTATAGAPQALPLPARAGHRFDHQCDRHKDSPTPSLRARSSSQTGIGRTPVPMVAFRGDAGV